MELPHDPTYTYHENEIIELWRNMNLTGLLAEKSESHTEICDLMDGPPFPSGELHPGHMAISALKDVIARFFNMIDVRCRKKIGFDCHGLPVETAVMKSLGLETSDDIIKFGIDKFCKACKDKINEVSGSWEPIFERIGRDINLKNKYTTMDKNFMESVWWIFSELNKLGLVYKACKVMPVSYSCSTVLSNFEAGLNYKDIDTVSAYVAFKMVGFDNTSLVAWTTTPWTLPSNIALCVNPDMMYVMCTCSNGEKYIVSEDSAFNLKMKFVVIEPFRKGSDMVGLEYEPLFSYLNFKYHKVIADPYVKKSDENMGCGTGIVHIAPAFGEDDCRICVEKGIISQKDLHLVCPVKMDGTYTEVVNDYAGMNVFDADEKILLFLVKTGKIVRRQKINHKYPHCYRKDTKLIYMACPSFFVEVTKLKETLVERNKQINWTNEAIGSKRFHNWLEQAKDWSISRTRFFGTPLPVLVSEDDSDMKVFGSVSELTQYLGLEREPDDIHNDWFNTIDHIDKTNGKRYKSTGFVFDCWFESGCVPFGQLHYPFENADYFSKGYPNFVVEGLDQTRGWFYTLLVIFTAVTPANAIIKVPFKNVICMGLILDENGEKFSKKLNNFVKTDKLLKLYGADALRMYLIKSPLVNGEPLCFNETHIKELFAKIIPLVNASKFYLEQYVNANRTMLNGKFTSQYLEEGADKMVGITNIDLWILERVATLGRSVKNDLKDFKLDVAAKDVVSFIDILTNWYVKLNRDR
ncbi:MAG: isoleucine--tRNA ligase, partial [Proteobacteria bacterium]|nr:isoleucine--tRNA ligase [Pseudomonadota bacterium]